MKSTRISVSLRSPLHEWLRIRAADKGRSISAEVRDALERFMESQFTEGMTALTKSERSKLSGRDCL